MDSTTSASDMTELLLCGPRGRRLLLEYALESDRIRHFIRTHRTLDYAVMHASGQLDVDMTNSFFGWGSTAAELDDITPAQVAELLNGVQLLDPTPDILRHALATSVDSARYWQAPEGEDVLAATPEILPKLRRVAEHIAASRWTDWWTTPVDVATQQAVLWDAAEPQAVPEDVLDMLRVVRHNEMVEEETHARERMADPTVNWSGEWWSTPAHFIPSSTRVLDDNSPAGLWFVEDSFGWDYADSVRLIVPEDASVFEVRGADDWATLCTAFPCEVTASKQDDWYLTTGQHRRWVVPDWAQVAEHYDGVHLQVGAYLSSAGVAIPVDEASGIASVIAGWNLDETYWFSPDIAYGDKPTGWISDDTHSKIVWRPAAGL